MSAQRTPLDFARDLIARGLAPIRVPFGSKRTFEEGWPSIRLTLADLPEHFRNECGNISVLPGEPSGLIVDVDLDHPHAVELADSFLPHTGMTWGRASKPRSHRLYRLTRPARTRKWLLPNRKAILELRSTGCQTVAPGSTHPSGERVRWDDDGEPALIDPDDLIQACERLADAVRESFSKSPRLSIPTPETQYPRAPMTQRPQDPISLTPGDVLKRCAVKGPGQHDTMTFDLARGLKIDCGLTIQLARPYFDRWWRDARPHCSEQDDDAAWMKFERAWGDALIGIGTPGIARSVLACVETLPVRPEEAGLGRNLALAVRAFAEMGRRAGGQPFACSARMLGERFGVSDQSAHEWIRGLVRWGWLKCTDRGRRGVNGSGKARRLVWVGVARTP